MAKNVREAYRLNLPGGGTTETGASVNGKVLVSGWIFVTSYTSGGEPLSPTDLGLTEIDFLGLDVRRVNDAGTEPAATIQPIAAYDDVLDLLVILSNSNSATANVTGEDAEVRYLAVGDAVTADLT